MGHVLHPTSRINDSLSALFKMWIILLISHDFDYLDEEIDVMNLDNLLLRLPQAYFSRPSCISWL